jgi:hypothetical protein
MWTTNIDVGGGWLGRNHHHRYHRHQSNNGGNVKAGQCWACLSCLAILIGATLTSKLWFGYDLSELRINTEYLSPANGTCTVVASRVDAWACCSYQHQQSCDWRCDGTSCSTLMARYDGSRAPWILQDTSRADQYCCEAPCCFHQTCITNHHDDDDHYHHHRSRQLGSQAADKVALEGSSSTTTNCQCDMWGTESYHFECSTCYDGVVEVAYRTMPTKAGRGQAVDATTRSSQHPGPCSGSDTSACAQGFVRDHLVGAQKPCWYDPAALTHVVMRRGYTGWRWLATAGCFAMAVIGCGCCCCKGWLWGWGGCGWGCSGCPCGDITHSAGLTEMEMSANAPAPAPSYNTTLVQPSMQPYTGGTDVMYGATAAAPSAPVLQAFVVPEE